MQSVFLNEKVAITAVEIVRPSVARILESVGERPFVHVIVLDLNGDPLFDGPIGHAPEGKEFEEVIARIARSKAMIHFRTGRRSRIVRERAPHLLLAGDTVHGGSAEYEGIIAAASGIQAHFDEVVAELVAATCWGLCKEAHEQFLANKPDEHFLGEFEAEELAP